MPAFEGGGLIACVIHAELLLPSWHVVRTGVFTAAVIIKDKI